MSTFQAVSAHHFSTLTSLPAQSGENGEGTIWQSFSVIFLFFVCVISSLSHGDFTRNRKHAPMRSDISVLLSQFMHMSEFRTAPWDRFSTCNMSFNHSAEGTRSRSPLIYTSQESPATCVCLSSSLFFLHGRSATHEECLHKCDVASIRRNVSIACFPLFLLSSDPFFSSITHRVHVFKQLNLRTSPLSSPVHRSPGLVLGPLCMSLCSSSI